MSIPLTVTQVATIKAIVNLFETGHVLGDYGQVTVIPGDTGHLTFGRSQTTLGSGNLSTLLRQYCDNPGARFRHLIAPSLPAVEARDVALDTNGRLHNVLRATADDPVMRDVQDAFFDQVYLGKALDTCRSDAIREPLGVAVVYDSFVHGSWPLIRKRVTGTPATRSERVWVMDYIDRRRVWLQGHPRADLRKTVYRMDALGRLVELGAWGLTLPLVVRGSEISHATLTGQPPGCFDGPQPGTRDIAFRSGGSLLRGLDVRLVQLALSQRGASLRADGVFGRASADAIASHQQAVGAPVTGVADRALARALASEV